VSIQIVLALAFGGTVVAAAQAMAGDAEVWRRTKPDFPVYLPTGRADATNQMVNAVETPRGTWLATFTMASREGQPDQRVVVTRSTDRGRTWSAPAVLDGQHGGDGRRASWAVPFVVPTTGRVYVLYNKNTGQAQVRPDTTGQMRLRYSDDDGLTWRDGGTLPVRMGEFGHPSPEADPNWIGLYTPLTTRQGAVLFPFARYKAGPHLHRRIPYTQWQTEAALLRFDNILTETDATRLEVTTLPTGPRGIRVPHPRIEGGSWANEPAIVELSAGRLLMVMRTRVDAIWHALSQDQGESWTPPKPLRYHDSGPVMLNPNAPVLITRLADGRIPMVFFNARKSSTFGPRDPAWLTVGVEALDRKQPVVFARPRQLMTVHNTLAPGATSYPQVAGYGSFFQSRGQLFLIYPDCKHYILGRRLAKALLDDVLRAARPEGSAPQ